MRISTIETGFLKLDGGAMFGIVPKRLWQRLNPPDDNNLCTWSMRCLLIEVEDRKILVDTGIGDKLDEKMQSHFEPQSLNLFKESLSHVGVDRSEITDVLLTHLHFDHVGGATTYDENRALVPAFPNATYWTNKVHWDWAMNPNAREKASFLKENFVPLQEAGVLKFIDFDNQNEVQWGANIRLRLVYGHTEAMMVPIIQLGDETLVYCADVMPSSSHIGMPYVMGYDLRPLDTLKEKKQILEEAEAENHILIFEHDPKVAACRIIRNDRGRLVAGETFESLELAV